MKQQSFQAERGLRGSIIPVMTIVVFVVLVGITIFSFLYRSKEYAANLMTQDIAQLQKIFQRIDEKCKILSFDYQKNPINFLNVGKFEGSEVGPMNLTYPDQWEGPYLDDNPTMQGKEYEIVRTKKGHFIVPGTGVEMPNGKEIGKDIILGEDVDIAAMMQREDALMYEGKSFAALLPLSTSELQKTLLHAVVHTEG